MQSKLEKGDQLGNMGSRNELSATSISRGLKTDALISGFKLSSVNLMIELHKIIKENTLNSI